MEEEMERQWSSQLNATNLDHHLFDNHHFDHQRVAFDNAGPQSLKMDRGAYDDVPKEQKSNKNYVDFYFSNQKPSFDKPIRWKCLCLERLCCFITCGISHCIMIELNKNFFKAQYNKSFCTRYICCCLSPPTINMN